MIQVEDDSPGMPEDVQEKISVPFLPTGDEGSGIGLSPPSDHAPAGWKHLGPLDSREGTTLTLRF